jgi:hypothetical protein
VQGQSVARGEDPCFCRPVQTVPPSFCTMVSTCTRQASRSGQLANPPASRSSAPRSLSTKMT